MDPVLINVLVGGISAILSATIAYLITKKNVFSSARLEAEKHFLIQKENYKNNVIAEHKNDDGFQAILSNEYLKGKIDGSKEELAKFSINYTPFLEEHDSFMKHSCDIGIEMQIFYSGLPIADPMRRITKHEEKFKEENLKYLIDTVNDNVKMLADAAISHNIPVRITQEPVREKKKKK